MATVSAPRQGLGVGMVAGRLGGVAKRWLPGLLSFAAFVLLWHFVIVIFDISDFLLPSPAQVWTQFLEISGNGSLWRATVESAKPLFLGLGMAIVVGIVLGLVIGTMAWLDLIASPYLWGLFATPRIAMAPLFVLWLGLGFTTKLWLVFLSAVLPMILSCKEGVQTVDESLIQAARSFGARKRDLFGNVIIPYTLPFIATGVRNSIARGFVGLLIIEMTVGTGGIGGAVMYAGRSFDSARMFAFISSLIVMAMVLITLSRKIEARMSRWREEVYV